jgi:hypothetical protein
VISNPIQELNKEVREVITMYFNGILTDTDLLKIFSDIDKKYKGSDLSNQVDPNSGLRYPEGFIL